VLSGPGLWLDWLEELRRESLLEELLAGGVIVSALEQAPHGHAYDRTLNGKMTVICVLVACLFPGQGYDSVLAAAFGLPGLNLKPGTQTPAGPALSKARALLGEQVMKRLFELDAARSDAEPGIGSLWKGLETTALDGTTMELFRGDVLADAFGVPADGARPLLRAVAHVRTATRRWIAAAAGGYHDGENTRADELEASFRPGILNLAARGFFSMDRWIRFSAAGAHLAWRIKNGAKSVPLKTLRTQDQDHPPPGPDHPAGPSGVPGPRDRRPVRGKMAGRNRVPAPEENRPRHPPPAARPVPGTGPPGSLGPAAHPQHDRHRSRPRRRPGRD
jgi:hypothetical protein